MSETRHPRQHPEHQLPLDLALNVRGMVEAANEMARHNGFRPSFAWTGGLKFTLARDEVRPGALAPSRMWVQVAPGDDEELSVQWLSDDGHNAIDYDDLEDEDLWLL
jgi:hypothetical protein